MRRFLQFSVLCLAAGVVNACKPEEVIETDIGPVAAIRFVHAVPDTMALDFRPVDIVENTHFYTVAFRGTGLLYYKPARAGQRHFKIFLASSNQAVAQTVIQDINVTLEEGKHYTFMLWGNSRTGAPAPAMQLTVLEDNPADPGNQVALRVINATGAALDVSQYASGDPVPASPTWANVAPLSASGYEVAAAGSKLYNVQPAGGGAALFTDPAALAGSPATIDREALPGTTVAGSAVSGIVFPASVAESLAPLFASPGMFFVWDRRPPRTCSPLC